MTAVLALFVSISGSAQEQQTKQYEVKVITSVESIIPSGLGRSRLISSNENRDYKDFTSNRTEDSGRNKSKRHNKYPKE